MKKLLIGSAGVIVLLGVGLIALPSLIPSSVYKEKIESQLSRELARDVSVLGEVKLSVFPLIKANTGRVEIDNPNGFSAPQFASMDAMSARVKLLPLFSRRIEITSFTLKNPSINLEKTANGAVNWAFGDSAEETDAAADKGPFKRDGRYANIDPSIGKFTLEDGQISYDDKTIGTRHALDDVNVDFTLTGLADPLKIAGDLVYNGTPAELDLFLESPREFLDGRETDVSAELKTQFAEMDAQGRFLASDDIAFNLDVNGGVSDMQKLLSLVPAKMLGENAKYSALVQSATLSGNYNFDGKTLSAKGADISANGTSFDASFAGKAVMAETPVFDGSAKLNARDIASLAKTLELDISGLELIDVLDLTAELSAQNNGFRAQDVRANLKGDSLAADFFGSVNFDEAITAKGNITAEASSVPAIVKALGLDLPQTGAVQALSLSSAVDYSQARTVLSGLDVTTSGGPVTGSYKGSAAMGDTIGFSGEFAAAISSLTELSARTGIEIPYANAIGIIDVSGAVSGEGENLSITGLSAALKDGLLNGRYDGSAALNKGVTLNGRLSADILSLRKLAALTGNNSLPPSTNKGQIYEAFSIAGDVKGTPETLTFSGADILLDHIKAAGNFVADMGGTKPFITAKLASEGLNLEPYMAAYSAQNPTGEIQPWSQEPLNFAALNMVDGDFDITTPSISTGRMTLGQSDINAKLRAGVLTADLPNMSLYGGSGRMNGQINAAQQVPAVSLEMGLTGLGAQGFLGAVAGFTNASGTTGTSLKIQGKGRSQAQIMQSLSGQGDFKLVDGQIAGVDLKTLMSGLDQAFASRTLPGGIGASEVTKFKDIIGLFDIQNGVASVDKFSLQGLGVLAEGGGAIDLGAQKIDFSLRPRLTGKSANDLASFGIPIRVQGGFGDVKIGLDSDLVAKIAAERARVKAGALIEKEVGEALGGILGGVIGGQAPAQEPVSTEQDPTQAETETSDSKDSMPEVGTPSPSKPTPTVKEQAEEKAKDAAKDLLGGLFGSKKETAKTDEAAKDEKDPPQDE